MGSDGKAKAPGAVSRVKGVRAFHVALEVEEVLPPPGRPVRRPPGARRQLALGRWHFLSLVNTVSTRTTRKSFLTHSLRGEATIPRRWNGACFRGSEKGPEQC